MSDVYFQGKKLSLTDKTAASEVNTENKEKRREEKREMNFSH
jgi:hypothetical protein